MTQERIGFNTPAKAEHEEQSPMEERLRLLEKRVEALEQGTINYNYATYQRLKEHFEGSSGNGA